MSKGKPREGRQEGVRALRKEERGWGSRSPNSARGFLPAEQGTGSCPAAGAFRHGEPAPEIVFTLHLEMPCPPI